MRVPVVFEGWGKTAWVPAGSTISEAAVVAGVPLPGSCGRRAICGLCGVRVLEGTLDEASAEESSALTRAPAGVRLACRARVLGPVTVKPVVAQPGFGYGETVGSEVPVVVAVDLGTTSVSAVAVEPDSGREIGRATVANAQQNFGADVLSRVSAYLAGDSEALRQAAETSILAAIEFACPNCEIRRLVVAGNSAMAAILTESDVSPLAKTPFAAPRLADLPLHSGLRERVAPGASIDIVPPIAAFVGGDVLCGVALLLGEGESGPACLVDMGTNAEVAVVVNGVLTVTSAPAGPAFEGWGTSSGGPAVPGAISSVAIDGDAVLLQTIGDESPLWFSGAGLVSAIAALRRAGHLDVDGLLHEAGPLHSRFARDEAGVLAVGFGDDPVSLRLTQLDIRNFQLAKAAVRAALEMALRKTGVSAGQIQTLWVSGAFGQALQADDLVQLGIVPQGGASSVQTPGNTSLAGAVCFALEGGSLDEAMGVARCAENLELASEAGFAEILMNALRLAPYDI